MMEIRRQGMKISTTYKLFNLVVMFVHLVLILVLVSLVSGQFPEGAGKCVCREYRCDGTEDSSGSCQSTAFHGRWGRSCCKPFCTCKSECGKGESDEGQNGIPEWVTSNEHYYRRWEMANGGTRDEMGSCPSNQTFCCPLCSCRKKCNVADTQTIGCGNNHVMCCDIVRRGQNCETNEVKFTTVDRLNVCGQCSCQQECAPSSVRLRSNRCVSIRNLCCEDCSCKNACDVTEIDTTDGTSADQQCAGGLRKCCGSCTCKKQCQRAEKEISGRNNCYLTKRCCDIGLA